MSADLPFGSMTDAVFNENWSTIATEVKTILGAKGKTRRHFRIVAVYEQKTDQLVAELLRTSLGPVMVSRAGEPGDGRASQRGKILIGFRQSRGVNGLFVVPFTGIESQPYFVGHYIVTGQHIMTRTYPDDLLIFR